MVGVILFLSHTFSRLIEKLSYLFHFVNSLFDGVFVTAAAAVTVIRNTHFQK